MTNEELKASMLARIEKRFENFKVRVERMRRFIERGKGGGEEDRLWLDQFATGGKGIDVFCGDMLIGDAIGVDGDSDPSDRSGKAGVGVIGTDTFKIGGDELTPFEAEELDFVVSNYLDVSSNPLKTLIEWCRVLKKGRTLALVVRDAERYKADIGPLSNRIRNSSFTAITIKNYLSRAGFKVELIEKGVDKDSFSLRIKAAKL